MDFAGRKEIRWKAGVFLIILWGLLLFSGTAEAEAGGEAISVFADGDPVSFTEAPQWENGSLLVQLRPVCEALDLSVDWDPETSSVTVGGIRERYLRMQGDDLKADMNGKIVELPTPLRIRNGSAWVPVRMLGESFDYQVDWSEADKRVDVVSNGGFYVLQAVAEEDGVKLAKRLDEGSAANFAVKAGGATPLGTAIQTNRLEMAKQLLAYGADPNATSIRGKEVGDLPLSIAVADGNIEAVKLLLTNRAEVSLAYKGITPLEQARKLAEEATHKGQTNRWISIVTLLEEADREAKAALASEEPLIPFHIGEEHILFKGRGDTLWGFRDRYGNVIIEPKFAYVRLFSEGVAFAVSRNEDRAGYIDRRGNFQLTVDGKNNWLSGDFVDGIAYVHSDGKYGYINRSGEIVIPIIFDFPRPVSEGYANALKGKEWYVYDTAGKLMLKHEEVINPFHDGLAYVSGGDRRGFINIKDELVIDANELGWNHFSQFNDGLAPVILNDKMGFMDTSGKMVIPAEFEFACSFSEGLACASRGQGIGYIDKSGKWVIEPQYTHVASFQNGQALVWVDDQIGIIDRSNQFIVKPQFDSESSIIKGSPYIALFYKPGREDSQGMRILYKGGKPYYMLPDGSIVE